MTIIPPVVTLENFVGQEQIIQNIKMFMLNRKEDNLLPHLIAIGYNGGGKTTLGKAIHRTLRSEMDINFLEVPTGRTMDVAGIQVSLAKSGATPTIFFFDELHEMKPQVQEALYEPMDKGTITTYARHLSTIELPPIMIIGATTEPGKVLRPFMSRFIHLVYQPYTDEQIAKIISQHMISFDDETADEVSEDAALSIAKRSKRNPRLAIQNLGKVVAYLESQNVTFIDPEVVDEAMEAWGIDSEGFTELDWRYLRLLYRTLEPQGINNIAGMIGEDAKYIEETVEPYLINRGMVIRSGRGRRLTPVGINMIAERIGPDAGI